MSPSHDPRGTAETPRREFLKASALGVAAVSGLTVMRSVYAAGLDVIKIGMIGCGGRCSGAAAQCLKAGVDVRLVAMCDIFADRIESSRQVLRNAAPQQVEVDDDHCFTGFDGYQKVIDSVDVVLIACASKFHPMYAEAAIRAGKHVFVEKPHGIDPVGVRRMQEVAELAERKGLCLVSGLQSRFSLAWQETIQRIHDGAIGDIVSMQSMFLRGPYRVIEREPDLTETQYQFRNWYHFRWLSGDDVTQSLVHNLDRMSWVMQETLPRWCFGLAGRSSSFGEVYGDMFDHHTAVYEYENGARLYALCRTQVGCYGNSGDIILGTKGTCDLARSRIEGETNWRYAGPGNNPYEAEQQALIDAVRSGQALNSGRYMANSTRIAVLGQLACYTGRPTTWNQVVGSEVQFGPAPEDASFQTEPPSLPDQSGNYPLPIPGLTTFS